MRQDHLLCIDPYLASLVLGNLVLGVLLAVLALAVGAASLGNVDLRNSSRQLPLLHLCAHSPSNVFGYERAPHVTCVVFRHCARWCERINHDAVEVQHP